MIPSLRRLARDRHRLAVAVKRGARLPAFPSGFERLVLAAEDKRFWSHSGVDWIAVARALFWRILRKPRGGASTIEMQFVRTVTHRRERTARRKIREILLARELRQIASKRQILRTYLHIAYFGHEQTGAEAATRSLFRRSVAELCFPRQAFLAALSVWPLPEHRSTGWYGRAFRRARWILSRVPRLHY